MMVVCANRDECGNSDCDHAGEHEREERCKSPCCYRVATRCVEVNDDRETD